MTSVYHIDTITGTVIFFFFFFDFFFFFVNFLFHSLFTIVLTVNSGNTTRLVSNLGGESGNIFTQWNKGCISQGIFTMSQSGYLYSYNITSGEGLGKVTIGAEASSFGVYGSNINMDGKKKKEKEKESKVG